MKVIKLCCAGSGSDSRASLNNDDCDAYRTLSALDNYSRPASR